MNSMEDMLQDIFMRTRSPDYVAKSQSNGLRKVLRCVTKVSNYSLSFRFVALTENVCQNWRKGIDSSFLLLLRGRGEKERRRLTRRDFLPPCFRVRDQWQHGWEEWI
jgi:hypothetical protein